MKKILLFMISMLLIGSIPAQAEDLSGTYTITEAINPSDNAVYTGRVMIKRYRDNTYELYWYISGAAPYHGIGLLDDGVLSVVWSPSPEYGLDVYKVKGGHLSGSSVSKISKMAYGGFDLEGPPGLNGTYQVVTHFSSDGGYKHAGTVEIRKTGEVYNLTWSKDDDTYPGIGLLKGDLFIACWGKTASGGYYEVKGDQLLGRFASQGPQKMGVENLVRISLEENTVVTAGAANTSTVKKYYLSGELLSEWTIKDGRENGPAKSYYKNGQIEKEWTFKDGKSEGPAKEYHNEEWTFNYGKSKGSAKEYHNSRKLKAEYTYKDGKINGPYTGYFETGKVSRKGIYKDGRWDGLWKDFEGNGQLASERFYQNGKEEGTSKTYDDNGRLSAELLYKDGKREGTSKFYFRGIVKEECDYKNGKQQGPCKSYLRQELIKQMEKNLAAIKDISYTLSTSFRPQSDENAAWSETLRTSHWYKAPNLAKEDSIRLSLPGKPESRWIFKIQDNSLVAYEILKDGSAAKKVYPAAEWESVGPPNNLISDLKRRMPGLFTVTYDDSRKVYVFNFSSPDKCTYEISDETGLPLMMTLLTSDQDGTKIVRVQMTDIKINTGMADEVFRVPDQALTADPAVTRENQPHRATMSR